MTQLLIDAHGKIDTDKPGLCILGAGNCNDLDLNRLSTVYDRVTLIDIDQEAMEFGIARQAAANSIEIVCCDVTGNDVPDDRFDVVASSCLLTQLFVDLDSSTTDADQYVNIRRQHFLTMLRLMKPTAAGVFVTDVVSSDTVPNLAEYDSDQLALRMPEWIRAHNFFTGTNPAVIYQLLTTDGAIGAGLSRVVPIAPWLWNPGPRVYACYGMAFSHES